MLYDEILEKIIPGSGIHVLVLYPYARLTSQELASSFPIFHINAPGQEDGAATLAADYEYPSMEQLSEQVTNQSPLSGHVTTILTCDWPSRCRRC